MTHITKRKKMESDRKAIEQAWKQNFLIKEEIQKEIGISKYTFTDRETRIGYEMGLEKALKIIDKYK